MYKKIVTIIIIFIFLSLIPLTTAFQLPMRQTTEDLGLINRTFIRGFILFPRETNNGETMTFLAIRLHYRTITIDGAINGNIHFRPVSIPNTLTGYSRRIYIIGTFHGTINIAR